jgi:hypothetical protein
LVRALYFIGSGVWALFAVSSILIMFQVSGGNGSDFDFLGLVFGQVKFPTLTEVSISFGRMIGFVAASLVCLAVSIGLFVKGMVWE